MRKKIRTDDATNHFFVEKSIAKREFLHVHSDVEIYGVLKGKALVTISGEKMLLTDGEFAVVNKLENHCYEVEEGTETLVLNIGARYLRHFYSLYPDDKLPRWLKDVKFNQKIREYIENILFITKDDVSELRKVGNVCQMLSSIIEHYGLMAKKEKVDGDGDLVTEVVEYIYEHYSENITLENLANRFHVSPSGLSKKLGSRIGMDLRIFVNDIRLQKVIQMLDDPQNMDKTINEIALSCGFSSMSTFYRCYKRNFGLDKVNEE